MARPKRIEWVWISVLLTREERELFNAKVEKAQVKSRNDLLRNWIKEWCDADEEP